MADKLELLTSRLEQAIASMTDKLEAQLNRLEKAVERLESLHGGSVAPKPTSTSSVLSSQPKVQSAAPVQQHSQPQAQQLPAFTEFNKLYSEWEEKAKATANQDVIELTNIALHLFRWADTVVAMTGVSKKPSNDVFTNLNKYFAAKIKEIDEKFLKPRKIENQAKTIKEGVGAALWFMTEAPAIYLDGVIEPTMYNGNKVKTQKAPGEPEWIDKFVAILKGMKDYTKANHPIGLTWTGKTEGNFSNILEGKLSAPAPQASTSSSVAEPAKTTSVTQQAQSQPTAAEFTEFNHLYNEWEQKAKATENQDVIELTNMALHVFKWTDSVLSMANSVKKPSNDVLTNLNKYISSKAKEIDDKFVRPRKIENQAKTVKEGLGAALWFLTEAPVIYIDGVIEPTMYSGNKVKTQKAPGEPEWVDKFVAILKGFKDYTKEHYQTGLTWKGKTDGDFSQLLEGKLPSASSPSKPSAHADQPGRANLFADLNRGSAITQGLKVAERKPKGQVSTEAPLQPLATGAQQSAPKQAAPVVKKEPKTYLNNHWFIENYVDDKTIVMEEADMRQSVYIDNCHNCLIQVKGKVKSIMVSNCSKLSLIFDNAVSTVEAVNTKILNIQAKIHAPSIVLDKCERVKVYLAKNLETDIVSSKVTELNVSYLIEDDEWAKEYPVTEQFLTRWDPNAKKFVTKPMDLFIM